ncbi:MAG: ABC transporter ATP-binding protein [Bryobacterales bacterium]|nr:ABC transporter ATP-binding protein [Bryobacterales bacterium]
MRAFLEILMLGRDRLKAFAVAAILVSLGTGAILMEPLIYRSIIDDIAGVFVAPRAVVQAETAIERAAGAMNHLRPSIGRIFRVPMTPYAPDDGGRRTLENRTAHEAAATVILGALLLVVIRLLAEWFKRLGDNRAAALAADVERGFILRTFRHVIRLPLGFFTTRASGALARQIDQSDNVAPVFTAAAQDLWPDLLRLLAILVIMLTVNRELAIVSAVTILVYALVTWRLTRTIESESERYYALWDDVSSRIQQAVAGIKTVQAHAAEDHEAARVEEASKAAYDSFLWRNRVQNRYTFMQDAVISVSKACVLAAGGLKALEHQLTPGDVVMFLAYLDRLYGPIESLTGMYTDMRQHIAGIRRAKRLMEEPVALGEDLPPLRPEHGSVSFRDVGFGYAPGRKVLDGVSFNLKAGERTALIGPSGAGKTTIADLLVGLYRPQRGQVLVDGQAVDQVSPSSVRAAIRGVAADGTLFGTTIAENIRYGHWNASEEDVRQAAALAGLEPVLERLPDGLNTVIGERGVALSAGERQRVLLARAFVARPTVLILDEATANLDFRTEISVKRALSVLSEGRTTLLVAHRRSMLTNVDRVLVLREGRIEQDGTPEELMQSGGYFRDMMLQAGEAPR